MKLGIEPKSKVLLEPVQLALERVETPLERVETPLERVESAFERHEIALGRDLMPPERRDALHERSSRSRSELLGQGL